MQLVKVLCIALIALAVAVSANVADADKAPKAVHDKCGAKGGHCEVASGCGGKKLKGLCQDNGSGAAAVCCVPAKKAKKGKGLSPKQLAAKRKARAAAAKKQAKAAKVAGAAMAAQTEMAKALAKNVPAPSGKKAPEQPSSADAEKAAKEGAAVAKAAVPQPPAKAKANKLKVKAKKHHRKHKAKKSKKAAKGKGKKKASKTKKLGMRAKKGSRGIDVAQKTTKKHWKCLKKAGWDWAVVRGFRSSNRPDPHAARSLKLAAKAGFSRRKLGVYLYPCAKCGSPKAQVDRMVKHLKNHGAHRLFSTIWLDVEGRFWPAPKRTRKQKQAALAAKRAAAVAAAKVNAGGAPVPPAPLVKKQKKSSRYGEARAFFRSLVRACRAHKRYRCGVYTSPAQWKSIMGKRPIRMAKKMPLWYPQFDVTPSAATTDFEGFSGWDKAWAKQYSENQNVCGLSVDVNVRA